MIECRARAKIEHSVGTSWTGGCDRWRSCDGRREVPGVRRSAHAQPDDQLASACAGQWPAEWPRRRCARHVEELDRVAFFGNTRDDVPLHDSADVAGPKTVLGNIAGQDHVANMSKGMSYLGYRDITTPDAGRL
jgi:hypothetical protein